jgi:hypothetical protein
LCDSNVALDSVSSPWIALRSRRQHSAEELPGNLPSSPSDPSWDQKSLDLGLFGKICTEKSVDTPVEPHVDSPCRGECGWMFIDNREGWRPPSPRPPPSRVRDPLAGADQAGGVRMGFAHLRAPGILRLGVVKGPSRALFLKPGRAKKNFDQITSNILCAATLPPQWRRRSREEPAAR